MMVVVLRQAEFSHVVCSCWSSSALFFQEEGRCVHAGWRMLCSGRYDWWGLEGVEVGDVETLGLEWVFERSREGSVGLVFVTF
jgi:hypothetical protein